VYPEESKDGRNESQAVVAPEGSRAVPVTFPKTQSADGKGGKAGQGYEDRTRRQLYEVAKQRGIAGRSKMGKWELIDALRRS